MMKEKHMSLGYFYLDNVAKIGEKRLETIER